jgi:release factor glutamine methyltransferase
MQLYLQFERPLTEPELEKIRPLVKRRSNREPLQYILGETEFSGLKLKVDRRALIPRPETESLLENVFGRVTAPPATILDLGTGTGAIALVLATKYLAASITAVDKSAEALALARENAEALGLAARVSFIQSDWFSALSAEAQYELIVANPPYLSDLEVREAQPEVKDYEPLPALVAGENGLSDLASIIRSARGHLSPGGLLACETGIAQHAQLLPLAATVGYSRTESLRDLTGRERYLLAFV